MLATETYAGDATTSRWESWCGSRIAGSMLVKVPRIRIPKHGRTCVKKHEPKGTQRPPDPSSIRDMNPPLPPLLGEPGPESVDRQPAAVTVKATAINRANFHERFIDIILSFLWNSRRPHWESHCE